MEAPPPLTCALFSTMASRPRVRRASTRPPRVEMKMPARLVSVMPCHLIRDYDMYKTALKECHEIFAIFYFMNGTHLGP